MNCVNKEKWDIGLKVIRVAFETTSHAESNCMVRDVGVWCHWFLFFRRRNWQCSYCDILPICAYGEWVLVSRHTQSRHRLCHRLVLTKCSKNTYSSAVDEHFNVYVKTSHNLLLWRHFLASLFVASVGPRFLFMGLLVEQSFRHVRQNYTISSRRLVTKINAVPPAMLLGVMGNVTNREHQCINFDELHLTDVFKKGLCCNVPK
jgi:hypothetical protein